MSERDPLHGLFRPEAVPEPPAGLLEELRRQIPAEIQPPALHPGARNVLPFRGPVPPRFWLAAASIAVLLGGGSLGWLVFERYATFAAAEDGTTPVATAEGGAAMPAGRAEPPRETATLLHAAPREAPPAAAPAPRSATPPSRKVEDLAALGHADRVAPPPPAPPPPPRRSPYPSSPPAAIAPPAGAMGEAEGGVAGGAAALPDEEAAQPEATAMANAAPSAVEVRQEPAGEEQAAAESDRRAKAFAAPAPRAAAPSTAAAPAAARPLKEQLARLGSRPEARQEASDRPAKSGIEIAAQALAAGRLPASDEVTPSSMLAAVAGEVAGSRQETTATIDGVADPWAAGALLVHVAAVAPAQGELELRLEANGAAVDRWSLAGQPMQPADRARELRVQALPDGRADPRAIALLHVVPRADVAASAPLVTLRVRWSTAGGAWHEETRTLLAGDAATSWDRAPGRLRLAAAAARFASLLDDPSLDRGARAAALDELAHRVALVAEALPKDDGARVTARQLARLVARAREIVASPSR